MVIVTVTLAGGFFAGGLGAEESEHEFECAKSYAFFAPPDSPDYRKYAPDRLFNVVNLAIDVTPDFSNRIVSVKDNAMTNQRAPK